MRIRRSLGFAASSLVLVACAASSGESSDGPGDVIESAGTTGYGSALTCKTPHVDPSLSPLAHPSIVVSLNGLTLHLTDDSVGFDRVYPIGPGALDASGKSLTPTSEHAPGGVFHTGASTSVVSDSAFGWYYSCRFWDTVDGVRKPVFAGLPFIRLDGPPTEGYAFHGPIDHYTDPNGGSLRRGYVSHGCMRMQANDVQELFFLIHKHPSTPVRVQLGVERHDDGSAVDVANRWVGAECASDGDCNFTGGRCRFAQGAAFGTCVASCTHACADRDGEGTTFCVRDPAGGGGICVPQASSTFNASCARYEGRLTIAHAQPRPDGSASSDVCVPAR
jgi:hypothetical protein